MPNKQLTATVRLNTTQAEKKLKQIARSIDIMNRSVGKSSNAFNQIDKALQGATTTTKKVRTETDKWANSASKVNQNFKKGESTLSKMSRSIRNMLAAYVGVMGMRAVLNTSDTVTSAENRLNNLQGGNSQVTQASMDKIYAASMRSRSGYGDMLSNVSKTMTLAGDSFGNNIDNAIKFQEIMSKSYTIGGASAAEQASSMYQLVQALGSGVLQGDELRSVREGAPIAYKKIEEFAQGVFDTEESLKELASQGKITSDLVVAAIMDAEDEINKSFNNTKMTFAQAWNSIKNMALQAFRPVLQMLNDALNSDIGKSIIDGIGRAFVIVANTLLWVGDIIGNVVNWIAENWNWISYIIIAGLAMLVAYIISYTAIFIAQAIVRIGYWMAENWQMLLILVTIGLLVAGIIWLANNTASGCEFMVAALMLVAGAIMLIGLITGSTAVMVIGIIAFAVAGIVALMATCGEEVMGIIYTLGAGIYNVAIGLINGILQLVWTGFAEPFIGIVEFILNVCNGGFNSFGGAVANLIGQIISWFLSLGKVVTQIIDAIFGTDWTSGLNALQDKVLAWGKNEQAITLSREAPTFDRIKYGDAYNSGTKVGRNIENSLGEFGNSIKDKISGFGQNNSFNNRLLDPYSDAYNLGTYSPDNLLKNIDSNTSDIKDAMDLSNDDMEYLRRVAEMEWRNEFTTAEIRVEMTNNNTVNGERDLDGMVAYLSDTLREELIAVSNGVHIDD